MEVPSVDKSKTTETAVKKRELKENPELTSNTWVIIENKEYIQ